MTGSEVTELDVECSRLNAGHFDEKAPMAARTRTESMVITRRLSGNLPASFVRLWAASGISSFGDGVYLAALPLLGVSLTRNPAVLSVLTAAALLPWLLLGLIGGALVDRWDRRTTMWTVDVARLALLLLAALASLVGLLNIAVLVCVAFLLGVGQLLFDTAAQVYIPQLLTRDHELLQRANIRLRTAQTATDGFLGPPSGSALFAAGRLLPFVADALSFAASALLVRSLPRTPRATEHQHRSLLVDIRAGVTYLVRDRVLLGLALRPAIGNIAFTSGEAVLVLFARDRLHISAFGYGFLLATQAVGGLIGTATIGWLSRVIGVGGALTLTAAVEACAQLGLGLSSGAVMAGVALAIAGCAMSATMVLGPSIRQAIVPDHLMGRVTAAARLLAFGGGPIGALIGGALASAAGLRAPFVFGAVLLASMLLVTATQTSNARIKAALATAREKDEHQQGIGVA